MRPIVLRGHTRPVTSLVFSKEGDLLFSGSTDKTISAWYQHARDVLVLMRCLFNGANRYADNGERLGTYNGHNGMVTSVDVNEDTTVLASGAAGMSSPCTILNIGCNFLRRTDGEARLWDVRTGTCTRVLKHSSKVTSVAFSLGSQYLLTANDPWKGTSSLVLAIKYCDIIPRHPHLNPSVRRRRHHEWRGMRAHRTVHPALRLQGQARCLGASERQYIFSLRRRLRQALWESDSSQYDDHRVRDAVLRILRAFASLLPRMQPRLKNISSSYSAQDGADTEQMRPPRARRYYSLRSTNTTAAD
jgi:WD40 repeat protein